MGLLLWVPNWVTFFLDLFTSIPTKCCCKHITRGSRTWARGTKSTEILAGGRHSNHTYRTEISGPPIPEVLLWIPHHSTRQWHILCWSSLETGTPPLPDNFNVCQKRTRSLARQLAQSPGLLQTYNNILKEQLSRDFIEPVLDPRKSDTAHYIPHHPVMKNSDITPIRIVYDCSCHQSSEHPSLNDCLLTSPPFLVDLCACVSEDTSMAYQQI